MPFSIDQTTYRKDLAWSIGHGYGPVVEGGPAKRDTGRIRTILIHTTNSPTGNTNYRPEAVFLRDSEKVSTHYLASSHDTTIVQILPDEWIAWHAGDCADNDYENPTSLGVEIAWAKGAGPLPSIAIGNVTRLVRSLLRQYPHITKIDMHRAQAVPKGRKIDPSGWLDADFYAWRDEMLAARANEDPSIWAKWGDRFPLPPEQRTFGIPSLWKAHADQLGEARSAETYPCPDVAVQIFQGGQVLFEKATGACTITSLITRLP
jgi:hypothetical protein